jgi:hypothetical protein
LWRIARQRLAKHFPERYAVNKNRRPVLGNGFGYHGITSVSDVTTILETSRAVISIRFSRSYKRRGICQSQWVSRRRGISQPQELSQLASHHEREVARSPGGNGRRFRQSPIVSCYKRLYLSVIVIAAPINPVVQSKTRYYSSRNPRHVTILKWILER